MIVIDLEHIHLRGSQRLIRKLTSPPMPNLPN